MFGVYRVWGLGFRAMSYNSGISVCKVYELGVSVWCLELAKEVYPKLGWALVVGMVFIGLLGVVQGYIYIYIYTLHIYLYTGFRTW